MLFYNDSMIVTNNEKHDIALSDIEDILRNMKNGYIPTVLLGVDKDITIFKYGCNGKIGAITFNEMKKNFNYNVGDIVNEDESTTPYFRIEFQQATSLKIMIKALSRLYDMFSDEEKEKAEESCRKYEEYMEKKNKK